MATGSSANLDLVRTLFVSSTHVLATKSGTHVTLLSLADAYERTVGRPAPYRQLGFATIEEMVRVGMADALSLYRVGANMCVRAAKPANADSRRMMASISTEVTGKRGRGRGRFSSGGGGGSSGYQAFRPPSSCPVSVRKNVAQLTTELWSASGGEGCSLGHFGEKYFLRYCSTLRPEQFGHNSLLGLMRFLQSRGVIDLIDTPNGDVKLTPCRAGSLVADPDIVDLIGLVSEAPDGRVPLDQLADAFCRRHGPSAYRGLGFRSFEAMAQAEPGLRLVPRLNACPVVELADRLRPQQPPQQPQQPPMEQPHCSNGSDQRVLPNTNGGLSGLGHGQQSSPQPQPPPQPEPEPPQLLPSPQLPQFSGNARDDTSYLSVITTSSVDRDDVWSVAGDSSSVFGGGGGDGSDSIPPDCTPIGHQLPQLPIEEYASGVSGSLEVSVKATCPDDLVLTVHSASLDQQRRRLQADMDACDDWQPIRKRHVTLGVLCAARIGERLLRAQVVGYEGIPRAGRVRVKALDEQLAESVVRLDQVYYLKRRFADTCCQLAVLAFLDCLSPAHGDEWSEAASDFFVHLMESSADPKLVQIVRRLHDEPPYCCSVMFVRPHVSAAMIDAKYAMEPQVFPHLSQPDLDGL